jgi:hypothetical protein
LFKRARRIHQFNQGFDLLREAAALARSSDEKIVAAEKMWLQMLLDREPRAQRVSNEAEASPPPACPSPSTKVTNLAAEGRVSPGLPTDGTDGVRAEAPLDQELGALRQGSPPAGQLPPEKATVTDVEIGGTPGVLMAVARSLLRRVDGILREALHEAVDGEDVAEPGEGVDHVYYRLIESELGLSRTAAARLLGRKKLDSMTDYEQDRLRKLVNRRRGASKKVLDQAKAHFLPGFKAALEKRGIQFDPKDEPLLDQYVRQALLEATADPTLDAQVPLVKLE